MYNGKDCEKVRADFLEKQEIKKKEKERKQAMKIAKRMYSAAKRGKTHITVKNIEVEVAKLLQNCGYTVDYKGDVETLTFGEKINTRFTTKKDFLKIV